MLVDFSTNNIDIVDETLDGKNTFHVTQMAAWQRGGQTFSILDGIKLSKNHSLKDPKSLEQLHPVAVNQSSLKFSKVILAFKMLRYQAAMYGWKIFNQWLYKSRQDVTTKGLMPIIQASSHEYDTLNTVVKRCVHISASLGQKYTVITIDQALYCKLAQHSVFSKGYWTSHEWFWSDRSLERRLSSRSQHS